jgi:hypothetical protein
MSHVDEGVLQALLDGEIGGRTREEAERHLLGCARCASQMEAAHEHSDLLTGALAVLDAPAPTSSAYARVLRERSRRGGRGWGMRDLARAAILIIGFSTAAYAIPGSPVRGWVEELWGRLAGAPAPESAPAVPAAPEAPPATMGISVLPSEGHVDVVVREPATGLRIRARLEDVERAQVLAVGPAGDARFQTAPGRIEIVGPGAGELTIILPRGADVARIAVDGRIYVYKEGQELRATAPAVRRDDPGILIEFD